MQSLLNAWLCRRPSGAIGYSRLADMRKERLEGIELFMDAAQEIQRVADDSDQFDHAAKLQIGHRLWALHKRLTLICSDELISPLDQLTHKLNRTLGMAHRPTLRCGNTSRTRCGSSGRRHGAKSIGRRPLTADGS